MFLKKLRDSSSLQ